MVQFQLLTGSQVGAVFRCDHFPIRAGSGVGLDLELDGPGVWGLHFVIDWCPEGLVLETGPDALLQINDVPVRRAVLRNGDIFSLGALKIRFSLSPARQSSLALCEWLTWVGLAALCPAQIILVYWLIR